MEEELHAAKQKPIGTTTVTVEVVRMDRAK
jgi:hypothetical protein